jgi:hypothetical protein
MRPDSVIGQFARPPAQLPRGWKRTPATHLGTAATATRSGYALIGRLQQNSHTDRTLMYDNI